MKRNKTRSVPVRNHAGIPIREVRPNYFMVDFQYAGKRERKCFSSLEEAKSYCVILQRKVQNEGLSAFNLSAAERSDALKALRELGGKASLFDAARFWKKHNTVTNNITCEELAKRWIATLRARGNRQTTLREREHKTQRFNRTWGPRSADIVTRTNIIEWLQSEKVAGATWDGYRRCLHAMFQYGVEEGMLDSNPVAGIKKIRMDERLPSCFTVSDVKKVLDAAVLHAPIMAPTLIVQFFAGLRPGEAKGLDWSHVDFEAKLLRIKPETSKARRARFVDMNPALIAWLSPFRRPEGAIGVQTQNQFDYYMTRKTITLDGKEFRGLLGLTGVEWIQDGPRKTYASMHYAQHNDAPALAASLGHTGGHDVLFRHYRGLVKPAEAKRYWTLRPD